MQLYGVSSTVTWVLPLLMRSYAVAGAMVVGRGFFSLKTMNQTQKVQLPYQHTDCKIWSCLVGVSGIVKFYVDFKESFLKLMRENPMIVWRGLYRRQSACKFVIVQCAKSRFAEVSHSYTSKGGTVVSRCKAIWYHNFNDKLTKTSLPM